MDIILYLGIIYLWFFQNPFKIYNAIKRREWAIRDYSSIMQCYHKTGYEWLKEQADKILEEIEECDKLLGY